MSEKPRPCDRCGATIDAFDGEDPMCRETSIGVQLLVWLCHNCCKSWNRYMMDCPELDELETHALRYEYWKAQSSFRETGIETGIALLKALNKAERIANVAAGNWVKSCQHRIECDDAD